MIRFTQALMELINKQEYISWKLPKNWHIILTANPDNGDYFVQTTDNAQKTRFMSVNLKFDVDIWAKWAEEDELDERCINFLLMNPELVTKDINARIITIFFNSISTIKNFEEDLLLIQLLGESSVGSEFASLFTLFINNKLDKLISPKTMLLEEDEDKVLNILKRTIGTGDNYRGDIASVLTTRFLNFTISYSKNNTMTPTLINRIKTILLSNVFSVDLTYFIVRELIKHNKQKFEKLLMDPEIIKLTME